MHTHTHTHTQTHTRTHTPHPEVLCLTVYVLLFRMTAKVKAYAALIYSNQVGFYDALKF